MSRIEELKIEIEKYKEGIKTAPEIAKPSLVKKLNKVQAQLAELEQAEKDSSPAKKEKEEVVSKQKSAEKPEGKVKEQRTKVRKAPKETIKDTKAVIRLAIVNRLDELEKDGQALNLPFAEANEESEKKELIDWAIKEFDKPFYNKFKEDGFTEADTKELIAEVIEDLNSYAKLKAKNERALRSKIIELNNEVTKRTKAEQKKTKNLLDANEKIKVYEAHFKAEQEAKVKRQKDREENKTKVVATKDVVKNKIGSMISGVFSGVSKSNVAQKITTTQYVGIKDATISFVSSIAGFLKVPENQQKEMIADLEKTIQEKIDLIDKKKTKNND